MTLYTYFLWVTLESMIPWKIHWASHYHFCQFWNGIVRFLQDDNIFIWISSVFGEFIPIQFCWRKIWTLFRSQFCTGFVSIFYVTLSDQPIWQTVQNHILGHNFFYLWKDTESWYTKLFSMTLVKVKMHLEGLNGWNEIVKPKKLKVIVWQRKLESHLTFFSKPNKTCYCQYCKWWLYIISNQSQQPAVQINLILATHFGDGTDLRRSPLV